MDAAETMKNLDRQQHLLEEVAIGDVLRPDTLVEEDADCDLRPLRREKAGLFLFARSCPSSATNFSRSFIYILVGKQDDKAGKKHKNLVSVSKRFKKLASFEFGPDVCPCRLD